MKNLKFIKMIILILAILNVALISFILYSNEEPILFENNYMIQNNKIDNISDSSKSKEVAEIIKQESLIKNKLENTDDLVDFECILGVYYGIQKNTYLKNPNGKFVIVNGQKIPLPDISYNIELYKENRVDMLNTDRLTGENYFLSGKYIIKKVNANEYDIICNLTDRKYSHPTIRININCIKKIYIAYFADLPDLKLEKFIE